MYLVKETCCLEIMSRSKCDFGNEIIMRLGISVLCGDSFKEQLFSFQDVKLFCRTIFVFPFSSTKSQTCCQDNANLNQLEHRSLKRMDAISMATYI